PPRSVTSFCESVTPHTAIVASAAFRSSRQPTMLTRKSDTGTWVAVNESPMQDAGTAAISVGERRLMVAVLVRALRSVFRDAERPGRGALRRLRQDVRWLTSPDRS